ncbi:unnamed protein product [Cyprideis torosa]|uniref:Uncharacterized protein n=1 Tax=Cyprideis torosa TaxID=163714 RepID=A0A7R8WBM8_9CRUS|nr:unnamed protein product [Cyprideis torosa]CAG0887553.1 unnamed protein product [Cyprideis torosa]
MPLLVPQRPRRVNIDRKNVSLSVLSRRQSPIILHRQQPHNMFVGLENFKTILSVVGLVGGVVNKKWWRDKTSRVSVRENHPVEMGTGIWEAEAAELSASRRVRPRLTRSFFRDVPFLRGEMQCGLSCLISFLRSLLPRIER